MSETLAKQLARAIPETPAVVQDYSVDRTGPKPRLCPADENPETLHAVVIDLGRSSLVVTLTDAGLLATSLSSSGILTDSVLIDVDGGTISELTIIDGVLRTEDPETYDINGHIMELIEVGFPREYHLKAEYGILLDEASYLQIDGKKIDFHTSVAIARILSSGKAPAYGTIGAITKHLENLNSLGEERHTDTHRVTHKAYAL